MQVKEKVFILKATRYGDADLILHALTPKGSRISLFARSALKSKKRFGGGVLEPTHYVSVLYDDKSARAESPLHTLKEASLIESFPGLRTDYNRIEAALHFLQLVNDASYEGDVHADEVFNLLGNALKAAETTQDLSHLRIHFETKLLGHHGILPIHDEEAILLRTSIVDHEQIVLGEGSWHLVNARLKPILTDYLSRH